jgi:DNA-binding transcriptional MerR regulator
MERRTHIYFLHDRTTQTIKIGCSWDPEQRMKNLQAGSPSTLVPLRYVPVDNGFEVEHLLHQQFSHLRVRGEWFQATPELMEFSLKGDLPSPVTEIPVPAILPKEPSGEHLTLAELAERTGVSARTLRYYISQGVLHAPWGVSRSAFYDQTHLDRVAVVVAQQKAGRSLTEIASVRSPLAPVAQPRTAPELWVEYELAPDCKVGLRLRTAPWRKSVLLKALAQLERDIEQTPEELSSVEELMEELKNSTQEEK